MKFKDMKEEDLFNGFVWIEKDGRAASMFYGKKVLWSYVIENETIRSKHIYCHLSYAMLAATYSDDYKKEIQLEPVKILVQPEGGTAFFIDAKSYDVHHAIVDKFRKHYERNRE